jgi:hypothetical protein
MWQLQMGSGNFPTISNSFGNIAAPATVDDLAENIAKLAVGIQRAMLHGNWWHPNWKMQ